MESESIYAKNSASMPCDGADEYSDLLLFDLMELETDVSAFSDPDSSTDGLTIDLPLVDGNDIAEHENTSAAFDADAFSTLSLDDEVWGEMFAVDAIVSNNETEMNKHFFRNPNAAALSDDLVQRIAIFYQQTIANAMDLVELIDILQDICLMKKKLAAALAAIESPELSPKTAKQLEGEMKASQTAQSRALLLALIVNRAMVILESTRPEDLNRHCSSVNCTGIIGELSKEIPDVEELNFITRCMGAMNVMQHELQLDCNSGLSKKGMVITAAVMVASESRTYSNGGRQATTIQILEGMFHRITGRAVIPRGVRRNFSEMSDSDY